MNGSQFLNSYGLNGEKPDRGKKRRLCDIIMETMDLLSHTDQDKFEENERSIKWNIENN